VGGLVARPVFPAVGRVRASGALGLSGIAFAFLLAWAAERAGSAMIVGAFAAGLVLYKLPQRHDIEKAVTGIGHFFVPVFFAAVGAAVDLRALADPAALKLGAVLIVCGIAGKVLAGYAPWWFRGDKTLVGIGMIPRGEVGLIFARMGLAAGAVGAGEYGALMLMVLVTTFVTPPALMWRSKTHGVMQPSSDRPGEGGVDDLVSGVDERRRNRSEQGKR
jgi:Kef-type K+ transport system membrane component KefB